MGADNNLYLKFKVCLLIDRKSIKDFADEKTGTSPQHVTMVAKGEKESEPVKTLIHQYVDSILSVNETQTLFKQLINHGQAINNGAPVKRRSESSDGEDYDW